MKVGVNEAKELKALAVQMNISFANLLRGYVLEDLMLRVEQSDYREHLWLQNDRMLGEMAYRRGREEGLAFFYRESRRLPAPEKQIPGQVLTAALAVQMFADIFGIENRQKIHWESRMKERPGAVLLELSANYKEMTVPLQVDFVTLAGENLRQQTRVMTAATIPGANIEYYIYSAESRVSQDLFEMMEKLELIGDMGAYYRVYQILKSQPLSGRYMVEELTVLIEKKPQVKQERRIRQLADYRSYAYMRGRWEQYARRQGLKGVSWEEALDLILAMAGPVWMSLCKGEVYFDDWMPELGRMM